VKQPAACHSPVNTAGEAKTEARREPDFVSMGPNETAVAATSKAAGICSESFVTLVFNICQASMFQG
jgi:hypothetical protein